MAQLFQSLTIIQAGHAKACPLIQTLGFFGEFKLSESIEIEKAVKVIASAFAPLRCVAEPWDYDYRIRFRVFDKDEPILTVEEILETQFSDRTSLSFIINEARSNLTNRGFNLTAWQFPSNV